MNCGSSCTYGISNTGGALDPTLNSWLIASHAEKTLSPEISHGGLEQTTR